ncbi:MAG: response regulator [Gammaproteobacteria bacterium]|nr:response regulator [Gammaproteobacteria bacterium]
MSTQEDRVRVLLVDDNRAIHDDLHKILVPEQAPQSGELDALEAELFGAAEIATGGARIFDLSSAYQGQEGVQLAARALHEQQRYAVAFIDMRMPPGWDGMETIERLWQVDPDVQVVICTAYSDHTWSELVERLGRPDQLLIIKKPFDVVEVQQAAHALGEKWRLQRELAERMANLDQLVRSRTRSLEDANERLQEQMEERSRMEQELRLAQKLEAVGQLAAGIAHEINTPTQFVGDNLQFLRDAFADLARLEGEYATLADAARAGAVPADLLARIDALVTAVDRDYLFEEIPRALAQAADGVSRVSRIVGAMKTFAHPDGEDKEVTDLNALIESTLTVTHNEWKYVAELKTELDAALPAVACHQGALGQVLINLIVNAAHAVADVVHAQPGTLGRITISTRAEAGAVEIRIADSGTGIPEAVRERIFDPFFTTKEVGKGTGQGLAIARTVVVDRHGGRLDFETETGRGTTFIIRLPADRQQHEEAA